MCLENYNIKSLESEEKTNKKSRITYEERITIEYLYKKGYGPTKIGKEIGRDKSVVSREIKRNKEVKYSEVKGFNINVYRASVAQGKYKYNKKKAGRKSSVKKDNGHEFINYEKIEKLIYNKEKMVEVYYTDPYSSWQKGMNENCNGILRRFIPKGTDLSKISDFKLESIVYKINNKPRKILEFESADYLFKKELNDILNVI